MQHDEDHPEDVDSDGEDHAVDQIRYSAMSRPFTRMPTAAVPIRGINEMTIDEAWQRARKPHSERI